MKTSEDLTSELREKIACECCNETVTITCFHTTACNKSLAKADQIINTVLIPAGLVFEIRTVNGDFLEISHPTLSEVK